MKQPFKTTSNLLLFLIALIALPVAMYLAQNEVRFFTPAEGAVVDLFIEPSQQTLPPDSNFSIMLDTKDQAVTFTRVVITFDPNKIHLVKDYQSSNLMNYNIDRTSVSEANSTGKITIVQAVTPSDPLVEGLIEVAQLTFTPIQTSGSTTIDFDASDLQIVHPNESNLDINTTPTTITLTEHTTQPTPSPTPSYYPTPSTTPPASPTPTFGSGPTPASPTPTSGGGPTPTPLPQPTNTPSPEPTLEPTNPPTSNCTSSGGACRVFRCFPFEQEASNYTCDNSSHKCCVPAGIM